MNPVTTYLQYIELTLTSLKQALYVYSAESVELFKPQQHIITFVFNILTSIHFCLKLNSHKVSFPLISSKDSEFFKRVPDRLHKGALIDTKFQIHMRGLPKQTFFMAFLP